MLQNLLFPLQNLLNNQFLITKKKHLRKVQVTHFFVFPMKKVMASYQHFSTIGFNSLAYIQLLGIEFTHKYSAYPFAGRKTQRNFCRNNLPDEKFNGIL